MSRVLVTGSRDWQDFQLLHYWLMRAWQEVAGPLDEVTLVSGHPSSGADKMAELIWEVAGQPIERHPAEWRPHGIYNPMAGMQRNTRMVEAGADIAVAFIRNNSPGATDCATKAQDAGIRTKILRAS